VVPAAEPDITEAVSSIFIVLGWRAWGATSRAIQGHARPPSLVIVTLFTVREYAVILGFTTLGRQGDTGSVGDFVYSGSRASVRAPNRYICISFHINTG